MELTKVVIKNYRSIMDTTIELDPSCRVLVGINESGKSNILKALSLLEKDKTTTPADIRYPLEDEKSISEAYVYFAFSLNEDEIKEIHAHFASKLLCKDSTTLMTIMKGLQAMDFTQFCRSRSSGVYWVDVLKPGKQAKYWSLTKGEYSLGTGWVVPSTTAAIPPTFTVEAQDGKKLLKDCGILHKTDFPDIPPEYIVPATIEDVAKIIGDKVVTLINANLPDCVHWTYNEQNLLPANINIATFTANPTICIPLKNMFELAGITKIQEELTTAQATTATLRNLLSRVAKQTTQHIRSIWKEYQSIEILLEPNGPHIDASVRESFNRYDFASRSDGFKRFVSFLIMVSAKVKTNQIENTLLLIDEPEIGLHPSGARYLKDELIKIAEKNHVVYSTHSIFMVDKDCIERHLLVKKDDEVTIVTKATQSNIVDEEVIYNALGYSIFDNLKLTNVLFEGWRDKKLFQVAMTHVPKSHPGLRNGFKNVGLAHLQGASDAIKTAKLLEMVNRKYIIVSDCDQAAKSEQKNFAGAERSGPWKRWDELSNAATIVTGEDFIKDAHIKDTVSKLKGQSTKINTHPIETLDLSAAGGKLHCISVWVGNKLNKEEKKEFLNAVKDELVTTLNATDIEEYFYDYLVELLKHVPS